MKIICMQTSPIHLSFQSVYLFVRMMTAVLKLESQFKSINLQIICSSSKFHFKIQIEIWRLVQQEKKLSLKPSLFLIFANHPTLDKKEDKMTLMEEVIDFASK